MLRAATAKKSTGVFELLQLENSRGYSVKCRKLELDPQGQLNVARSGAAGRHYRLGDFSGRLRWRLRERREIAIVARERKAIGQCEIDGVEEVEEFGAELNEAGFSEESHLGVLHQREIPIPEVRPVEDVAAGIAQLTDEVAGVRRRSATSRLLRSRARGLGREREHSRVEPLVEVSRDHGVGVVRDGSV